MKKQVLGVKIDDVTMNEALEIVHGWLEGKKKRYIVTPNPEIIMAAQKDNRYIKLLNDADLSIPDGAGLKLSGKIKNTFAGVDFMEKLVEQSVVWGATVSKAPLRVGFLGGRGGVAELCAKRLSQKYPNLKISFARSDDEVDQMGNVLSSKYYGKKHNTKYIIPDTDLLFVAFGPPKQEKWIAENLRDLDVKVAMSVGGSFDYISGEVPRAPKWIRSLGFEWLFRLIIQPWRIKRQLALIKYVLLLIYDNK